MEDLLSKLFAMATALVVGIFSLFGTQSKTNTTRTTSTSTVTVNVTSSPDQFTEKTTTTSRTETVEENGVRKTITIETNSNTNTGSDVFILSPNDGEEYKVDRIVDLSVNVVNPQNVDKVEFYVQSGVLVHTMTQAPYTYSLDLNKHWYGITGKQTGIFAVKVYEKGGRVYGKSRGFYITP